MSLTVLPEWTVTRDEVTLYIFDGDLVVAELTLDISNTIFGGGSPSDELRALLEALRYNLPSKFKS